MEITLLILEQMIQFFLMLLMGYLLVKTKLIRTDESRTLTIVLVYLVSPCVIINSFLIEYTEETIKGLLLAFGVAIAVHILFLLIITICGKVFKLNAIEKASVMYSNAGNMIIPIVMSVLGKEWVLYSSAYVSVQLALQWTHARNMISEEKEINWKKIFGNVNLISILIGIVLFLLKVRIPEPITNTLDSVGSMMAPCAMFVMGMLMAGNSLKKCFINRRIYLIAFLRLFVCPVLVLLLMVATGITRLLPDAPTVLFISFLACTTPTSVTTTQLALLYRKDAAYSTAINIVSTVCSLATIPLMTMLYWKMIG
ncbi:MAG: AEC family transporter [Bariatricus sp.]